MELSALWSYFSVGNAFFRRQNQLRRITPSPAARREAWFDINVPVDVMVLPLTYAAARADNVLLRRVVAVNASLAAPLERGTRLTGAPLAKLLAKAHAMLPTPITCIVPATPRPHIQHDSLCGEADADL